VLLLLLVVVILMMTRGAVLVITVLFALMRVAVARVIVRLIVHINVGLRRTLRLR